MLQKGKLMLIRIIAELPGRLDIEMRRAWIGVEIKVLTSENCSLPPTLDPYSDEQKAYVVSKESGVESLKKAGKHAAAEFWDGMPLERLIFPVSICEVFFEKTDVN